MKIKKGDPGWDSIVNVIEDFAGIKNIESIVVKIEAPPEEIEEEINEDVKKEVKEEIKDEISPIKPRKKNAKRT